MPVNPKHHLDSQLRKYDSSPTLTDNRASAYITDYCQQTVEVHGRPHTCARLNDHAGKHQVAVPQVGLVKW